MSDSLGPVEVNFTIPDDFGKQADAAIKKMAGLTDAAVKMPSQVKAAVSEQREVVKLIEKDIKDLERQLSKVAPGTAKSAVNADLQSAKAALDEEKASLNVLEKQFDQTKEASRRLSFTLRDNQDQLTKMRIAGLQGTEAYAKLEAQTAQLADELADVRNVTRQLGDDQRAFKGFADGVTGLAGAFSAGAGAVGLFAGENENLEKIQTRVQSLMAITIGLQQVSSALDKDSAFMTVTVAKAKQMWIAAEKALTTALWGSNVAAKALMITLTGGLAIAIPVLIGLYDRWNEKQKKAVETQKESVRINNSAAEEAAKSRVEIEMTIAKIKHFNGAKESEKRMLEEVNKKYGDTFGTYKTLAQWLDVLKSKSSDYVKVMFLQAKANLQVQEALKFDKRKNEVETSPVASFITDDMVIENTNIFTKAVNKDKVMQAAQRSKDMAIKIADSWYNKTMKELELTQTQIGHLQTKSGINTTFTEDKPNSTKEDPSYEQKLAETKKFYELYKTALELGQKEAAAIFKKELPEGSATFADYINEELIKATESGDKVKLETLLPEKAEFEKSIKEALGEFKTYQEQKEDIEKKYSDKILLLQKNGSAEKVKLVIEARDKELKELDETQPLNKLLTKYKTYKQQMLDVAADYDKEIKQLNDAGKTEEAKLAEVEKQKALTKIILENEFEASNRITEMGKVELKAFMEKIKTKIDLMKAEGKNVKELELIYNKAALALQEGDDKDAVKKYDDISKLINSMSSAASHLNGELGQVVKTAASLASNMNNAFKAIKEGNGADAFGSIVNIMFTIADTLDKTMGQQHRIAKIEEERVAYNRKLAVELDNINYALEKQLGLIENMPIDEKFDKTIEAYQKSIDAGKKALSDMNFEVQHTSPESNIIINLENIKAITQLADAREAINKALADGLISQEDYDQALDYMQMVDDGVKKINEATIEYYESITATSAKSLSDEMLAMFESGKTGAADLAGTFEKLMKNAMLRSLQMKYLEPQLEKWFTDFAEAQQSDGLTPEEIEKLKQAYNAIAEGAQIAWGEMEKILPDSVGEGTGSTGGVSFAGMKQETASALLGQFTALRINSSIAADIIKNESSDRKTMHAAIIEIAVNTNLSASRLKSIDGRLQSIETDGIKIR